MSDVFPVTLITPDGIISARTAATIKDFDAAGACFRAPGRLPLGGPVTVRLRLPRVLSEFFRGMKTELPARVVASRAATFEGKAVTEVVVSWDEPLPKLVKRIITSHQRKVAVLVAAVLGVALLLRWNSFDYFWYSPLVFLYSFSLSSFLLSRFFISWAHRPPKMAGYTPSLSVVISVRNEEGAIAKTVERCFEADYPAHLREVIVIDDGSNDGTAKVLAALQKRFSALRVRSLPPQGKRHAMAAGIKMARGEIIVFVDSDTFLLKDALLQIVCGFEDPTLGASAGYTGVENSTTNMLTGMQEVRYYVSNRLLKSSESIFGCVTCCPGCLSAYRRAYLMEILDAWLNQKFLGLPATFGDDRSLTNYILRKYRVIYNDRAVASTLVPDTWRRYLLQQLRWKKSWLRETWIAGGFMFQKHPVAAISFYASSFFSLLSPLMVMRVLYLQANGQDSILVSYLLGIILIALLQSLYFLYKRPGPNWALGMLWMASSLVVMGPQTYYALLTVRKNHWGTR